MSIQLRSETAIETVAQTLAPFLNKAKESVMVNEHDAIHFLQSMRDGFMRVGELASQAQYQASRTEAAIDRMEAHLRLEVFPEYASDRGMLKPTEKDKEAFILLQPEHQKLVDELSKWTAVCKYIDSVRSVLYTASDDVKKTLFAKSHYNNPSFKA